MSIFELKEMDETTLSKLVQETCATFPNLKHIYSNDFLKHLVTDRFHYDNYLLWLLASREQYAIVTLTEISKFLDLLKEVDVVAHFKNKLRSTAEPVFKSYLTELEFAAYYRERGYSIELEPKVSSSGKNPEFKITSKKLEVYFEAKNVFWEEMSKMDKIETQIHGAIGRTNEKYVFMIYYTPNLRSGDVPLLRRCVLGSLKMIPSSQELPVEFSFKRGTDVLARIRIVGRPNKLAHGYLGGLMRSEAFLIPGGKEIRRKISQKIPQLPKDEAGVIVIEPGQILVHEEDVLDALYGDENVVINLQDKSASPVRIHNGTFSPRINTRLSAVIFFKKKWDEKTQHFSRIRVIYHNPFAKKKLTEDFFDDVNVKQFVPMEDEHSVKMVWR